MKGFKESKNYGKMRLNFFRKMEIKGKSTMRKKNIENERVYLIKM